MRLLGNKKGEKLRPIAWGVSGQRKRYFIRFPKVDGHATVRIKQVVCFSLLWLFRHQAPVRSKVPQSLDSETGVEEQTSRNQCSCSHPTISILASTPKINGMKRVRGWILLPTEKGDDMFIYGSEVC